MNNKSAYTLIMALSDKKILAAKKKGTIVITPFERENLNTSSYDVTLGEWYYREQPNVDSHNIYNLYNKKHTQYVWGEPQRAEKASKVFRKFNFDWGKGIEPNDKVILIQPGETILAHTREFIGGRDHITTMMQARSSLGRNFIEVCKCAGWGDVGYTNRWTMEITNNSRHYAIPLVVGRRIAQIVFMDTGEILDRHYAQGGKYASSTDLKTLKKQWQASDMIPKLHKDREIQKKK